MKKTIMLSLLAAVTVLSGCNGNSKASQELKEKNDSLIIAIEQRDASIDEMLECIRIVEEGFSKINEAQGRISVTGENDINRKAKLQEDVQYIIGQLEKNNSYIAKLKKMVAGNEKASKELKGVIASLEKQLEAKNSELTALAEQLKQKDIQITELNNIISDLTQQNTAQELRIIEKEKELNKVWYVIGTKKELKNEKILIGGDVLLGKGANMAYFTATDKNTLSEIATHSKKAKLLSSHPEGSYTIAEDEKGMDILKITDKNAFWSITRYLVIQVR